jgi:hypothetical protein
VADKYLPFDSIKQTQGDVRRPVFVIGEIPLAKRNQVSASFDTLL